jgi:hypothetical protein
MKSGIMGDGTAVPPHRPANAGICRFFVRIGIICGFAQTMRRISAILSFAGTAQEA